MIAFTVAANLMLKLGAGVTEAQRILFGILGWRSMAGLALFGCGGGRLRLPAAPGAAQPRRVVYRSTVGRGHHRRQPGAGRADLACALAWHRLHFLRNFPGRSDGASLRTIACYKRVVVIHDF